MALKQAEIKELTAGIAHLRESYSYWPDGQPSNWRTGEPLERGWMGLLAPSYHTASPPVRAQALLQELERRFVQAVSLEEKAEAVCLVRCWKTQRRVDLFLREYDGDIQRLARIWEVSTAVTTDVQRLRDLKQPEVALAIASTFAALASPSRSLGILDQVLAGKWTLERWVKFHLRDDGYLMNTPTNWKLYEKYQHDLREITRAAGSLRFHDAATRELRNFSPRDVEMALYQQFR
ncbi:MAG: hypothetical protein HYX89_02605 [Chloroflexi bacterium]|nr:hypothetical protein [Chloroflexota bacterium]